MPAGQWGFQSKQRQAMIFHKTKLSGAYLIERECKDDSRGYFARAFCTEELRQLGVPFQAVQANISHNHHQGTVRGMHYQDAPACEPKFICCIRGAVWDVIVDMRPRSPTYLQHLGVELSAENGLAVYVPAMFAHGNQALKDGSELLYLMGGYYTPDCQRGLRFDDPALAIEWPLPVAVISEMDQSWSLIPNES